MARKFVVFCAATLSLALGSLSTAEAGVINFASDPSWTAALMNPDESVGSQAGAAECYAIPVAFNPAQIPGACVVWLPGWTPSTPADLQGAFFSKDIFVPGAPVSGTISVAVDDWVQVSVNGVVVCTRGSITDFSTASAAQNPPQAFDLGPALRAGSNTIRVWARNGPGSFAGNCAPCPWSSNGAWVYFGGSIVYDNPVPTVSRSWGAVKSIYR